MTPQEYLDTAIVPAAQNLGICTLPHLQIGFGTAGQESGFQDVRQEGGGPALGDDQMEPATHASLWENFIVYHAPILAALNEVLGRSPNDETTPDVGLLMSNLVYGAMMMFVKYLDCPGAIPADLNGQAAYYVRWYNGGGAATAAEYVANYQHFSQGVTFPTLTT
jgi:hypothetical protein